MAKHGLLLIHGAGGGIEANYGPIMDVLTARHTVVGVDLPGAADAPLDLDAVVDRAVAAADAAGLDTFALSGYSLGGAVAMRLAARHPERVSALVLSAAFAHPDTGLHLAASLWHDLYASGQHEILARYLTQLALSEELLNALTPAQVDAAAAETAATLPPGSAAQADLVRRVDVRADLPRITAPTLVIVTTADALVSPSLQRAVAAAIPAAELAELPTGHLPFAERPGQWGELITGFLDSRVAVPVA